MERSEKESTQEVHVRVSSQMYEQVGRLAADLGMSRAELLRIAIQKGLPAIGEQHPPGRDSEDSSGGE